MDHIIPVTSQMLSKATKSWQQQVNEEIILMYQVMHCVNECMAWNNGEDIRGFMRRTQMVSRGGMGKFRHCLVHYLEGKNCPSMAIQEKSSLFFSPTHPTVHSLLLLFLASLSGRKKYYKCFEHYQQLILSIGFYGNLLQIVFCI